ncbi:hypothetical protein KXS11_15950 [Plantibacter flavus]|uniref:hypothetical protein n=1 Tax=Plantibacter flavus TaxID=150123 RepID=UPI003F166937
MPTGLAVAVLECPSAPEVEGFYAMLGARITRVDVATERRLHVVVGGGELLYVERQSGELAGRAARPGACVLSSVSPQGVYLEFARRMQVHCGEVFRTGAPALFDEGADPHADERYPGCALVDPAGNIIRFVRPGYFDRFRPIMAQELLSA